MDNGFISFHGIYGIFSSFTPDGLEWVAYALTTGLLAFTVINVMVMSTALYVWFERRAIGRFQSRLGPNRWGPFGLLQPIADIIKIITKEDTTPADADRPIFNVAPVLLFTTTVLAVAVIPFGEGSFLGGLNVSLIFIIGVTSLNTIAILMGGWASRNKYAMLGCMRGVAMLVSYEVPMALAMTGVVLISGSLALSDIVSSQSVPFLLVQPLGFLVFIAAASAEMSRTPFDQIEAESELGAGYHTEYSSMKFGIFQLAEFMAPLVTSIIVTVLFLSGYKGWSLIPGPIWFVVKVFGVLFVLLWVRATWPRLRIDQIMGFAWKGLFGLALINILVTAIEVMLLQDANGGLTSGDMWLMAAINWGVTIISVVVMVNVLGQKRLERPVPTPSPLANMYAEAD
ncbi:MAG: NADH-quinone oxidoreductase subunit NuoH [Chloroflexi bacterium]|nr:NADH-quinone oxidoreductase subunit NuoH [Chloroflexota bacterium]